MKAQNYLIVASVAMLMIGCSNDESATQKVNQAYDTASKAQAVSPAGTYCEIQVPTNRGRGNNNTETVYYPAFLRGDVDMDGIAGTRADAQLATKRIYVKQIEQAECAATADIGTFPQGLGPDGFFTAEDIHLWGDVKNGKLTLPDMGLVCGYDCEIVNHMDPKL